MKAKDLERLFDEGKEDVLQYFDLEQAERPNLVPVDVDLSLPRWLVNRLDQEALRLGVSRQSLITIWLADRVEPRQRTAAE
ncbi:MAG: BrnA antitoxin family protein [Rhizobium sp.]|nr:BrnA antitoxin family protein [Rhizobium sp.]